MAKDGKKDNIKNNIGIFNGVLRRALFLTAIIPSARINISDVTNLTPVNAGPNCVWTAASGMRKAIIIR